MKRSSMLTPRSTFRIVGEIQVFVDSRLDNWLLPKVDKRLNRWPWWGSLQISARFVAICSDAGFPNTREAGLTENCAIGYLLTYG